MDKLTSGDPPWEASLETADVFQWRRTVLADPNLPNRAKVTAMGISERYNRKYRCAWPSMDTLAKDTGQNERSVRYAVTELRNAGYLLTKRKRRSSPYIYKLAVMPERQECAAQTDTSQEAGNCRLDRQDDTVPERQEGAGKPISEPSNELLTSASRKRAGIAPRSNVAPERYLDDAHTARIRAALVAADDYSDAEKLTRLTALSESLGAE